MEVLMQNLSDVKAKITINIVEADYAAKVKKTLSDYRKKVDMPGFRKGHVPQSVIEKKYGIGAKAEVVNELIATSLYNYINENKVDILGEPMQAEDFQPYDFATTNDFSFDFEVAIAPKIEVTLNKEDKITRYTIVPTAEMIDKQVEDMRLSFGSMGSGDTIEANDILKGQLVERDGDNAKEGGIVVEEAMLMPSFLKDESVKAEFIGKSKNIVVSFCPFKAMGENIAEFASFIALSKEDAEAYKETIFSFEVKELMRRIPAELNDEFFKQAFGDDTTINTEEGLRKEIEIEFSNLYKDQADFVYEQEINKLIEAKMPKVEFAEDVLTRFLLNKEEKRTKEEVEKDLPNTLKGLALDLAKRNIMRDNNAREITREDIREIAIKNIRMQFAQYGMHQVPQDMFDNYLEQTLKNQDSVRFFSTIAERNVLMEVLENLVSVESKVVNTDEFTKIMGEEK